MLASAQTLAIHNATTSDFASTSCTKFSRSSAIRELIGNLPMFSAWSELDYLKLRIAGCKEYPKAGPEARIDKYRSLSASPTRQCMQAQWHTDHRPRSSKPALKACLTAGYLYICRRLYNAIINHYPQSTEQWNLSVCYVQSTTAEMVPISPRSLPGNWYEPVAVCMAPIDGAR
jgi:hypothetical protein